MDLIVEFPWMTFLAPLTTIHEWNKNEPGNDACVYCVMGGVFVAIVDNNCIFVMFILSIGRAR